ncbi:hypothetical protein [Nocardia grenadensis]|uniref:hypothetical protein n=1 Tax=Nocardia grenadensis TaxID=931537 RepID=UPI003D75653C
MSTPLPFHPVTGVQALGFGKRGPIWPVIGGSEDAPPVDPAGSNKPESSFEPITSQDALDYIIRERLARDRAKYSDYDALKQKADKYDEVEKANQTELERAQNALKDLQAERDRIAVDKLRLEVAGEKNVPVKLLAGTTREDLEAAADELLSWSGGVATDKPTSPKPNPQQGQPSSQKRTGRAAGAAEVEKRFGKKLDLS